MFLFFFFFLMIRRPPRSTPLYSSAASDVYKRQHWARGNSGAPTFLNVGREYPEPRRFTVLIWGQDRSQFPAPPDQRYYGRTIRITGIVEMYEGAPEMVISSPGQIEIVD